MKYKIIDSNIENNIKSATAPRNHYRQNCTQGA